jgi:Protein of unknown function (DUF3618)
MTTDGRASQPAPDDAQELQQQIERTREELGETVELLAAKTHVKNRARAQAAEVYQRALRSRPAVAGKRVWEATPQQLRRTAAKGADGARQRRVLLAAAAGLLVVSYLVVRRWRRR